MRSGIKYDMVRPIPKEVEELEGEEITCPLCREEQVELGTTKSDALQGFCTQQRSPFFLNEPKKLDSELLPDQEGSDQEEDEGSEGGKEDKGEDEDDDELDQDGIPWRKDEEDDTKEDDEPEVIGSELVADGDGDKELWEK